jgi:hypothetical protein
MIRDRELAALYARALVALARADGDITFEEGLRLQQCIADRCEVPLRIDDVLFEPTLSPRQLADYLSASAGPFRGSAHPDRLAEWIVSDGLSVILAKGHMSAQEATLLSRFAEELGVSRDEFQRLIAHAAPWFPDSD